MRTHELDEPVIVRQHFDGRFAVAVTATGEDGGLVLLVQESIGRAPATVVSLSQDHIRQLLAISEAATNG